MKDVTIFVLIIWTVFVCFLTVFRDMLRSVLGLAGKEQYERGFVEWDEDLGVHVFREDASGDVMRRIEKEPKIYTHDQVI